jgi:hypothetical protein
VIEGGLPDHRLGRPLCLRPSRPKCPVRSSGPVVEYSPRSETHCPTTTPLPRRNATPGVKHKSHNGTHTRPPSQFSPGRTPGGIEAVPAILDQDTARQPAVVHIAKFAVFLRLADEGLSCSRRPLRSANRPGHLRWRFVARSCAMVRPPAVAFCCPLRASKYIRKPLRQHPRNERTYRQNVALPVNLIN